jgi:hypothetical protein
LIGPLCGQRENDHHRLRSSHQFGLTPNFFERFSSDVSLIEANTDLRTFDPHSLAETEYWNAETIQYEKKFGQFDRTTYHLEPSTIVGHISIKTLSPDHVPSIVITRTAADRI